MKRRYGEIHVHVWTAAGSSKFTSVLGIKGVKYEIMKKREKLKVRKLQEQLINV